MKPNFGLLSIYALLSVSFVRQSVSAFDPLKKTNVVTYWGQNSVAHNGGSESSLAEYCNGDTIDVFALAFIHRIENGIPILNLSKHCSDKYPGTSMLRCPKIGQDIKACQARGKAVVVSIGGATGSYSLPDEASGRAFAEQIWNLFLGGSSNTRPFGDAIVDGIDLDLESGQNAGYVALIDTLKSKFKSSSSSSAGRGRSYYITAAPQCPYPDQATKEALEKSWFDLVWVQFYNNHCGVQNYGTEHFNFDKWNNWATTVSANKNVRILLGVPGGPGAAGTGVIDKNQLTTILKGVQSYSNFGGVMMWDAGIAQLSGLASAATQFLRASGSSAKHPGKHSVKHSVKGPGQFPVSAPVKHSVTSSVEFSPKASPRRLDGNGSSRRFVRVGGGESSHPGDSRQ
ncbi:glycoside hydrolase superfamily [Mortierella sp. GBAus27b]|nr:Chitinase 1 [Mortierella sp. GBA43]KAI8360343.1 glycoside hydrolase superfamily [Mortierella sp. GBAus27b]